MCAHTTASGCVSVCVCIFQNASLDFVKNHGTHNFVFFFSCDSRQHMSGDVTEGTNKSSWTGASEACAFK